MVIAHVEVEVEGKTNEFLPPEISVMMILSKLKGRRRNALGERSTQASSPFPAYFNDSQRQATKDAGKIAGLEVFPHHQRAHRRVARVRSRQRRRTKIAVLTLAAARLTFPFSKSAMACLSQSHRRRHASRW